jgi:hypothetical protein
MKVNLGITEKDEIYNCLLLLFRNENLRREYGVRAQGYMRKFHSLTEMANAYFKMLKMIKRKNNATKNSFTS